MSGVGPRTGLLPRYDPGPSQAEAVWPPPCLAPLRRWVECPGDCAQRPAFQERGDAYRKPAGLPVLTVLHWMFT